MTELQQTMPETTEGELFRLLVENVKDYAIFILDPEGRVRSWNPGAERLLGYSQSEIMGQPAALFFTPQDIQEGVPQRQMVKAAATGRDEDARWHVRQDGNRFWSEGTITPLWDEKHTLRGFAKIMRDRTSQKHSETALKDALAYAEEIVQERREIETRFTSLVKNVKDHAIITMDLDGGITSGNLEAERILGYSETEMQGRHFSLIFTPNDLQEGIPGQELRRATVAGRALDERWHVRKNGEKFWALGIVTPTYDASERHTGFSKILRDMTEQKLAEEKCQRARQGAETQVRQSTAQLRTATEELQQEIIDRKAKEEALRKSEERFRELTAHLHDVLWIMDAQDFKILYISPGYEKMWGRSCRSLMDNPRSYLEGIHPLDLEMMRRQDAAMYQTGRIDAECRMVRPDGTVRWVWIRGYAVREHGRIVRLVGVIEDITEKQEQTAKLKTANEGLQQEIADRKLAEGRLNVQYATTKALAESPSKEAAIPQIIEAICKNMGCAFAAVWMVDAQAEVLRMVQFWHSPSAHLAELLTVCREKTFSLGEGLPGRVWAAGEPDWVPDVVQEENLPRNRVAARCGLHAAVGFPIRRGQEILGVVEFFSERIEQPDKELLEMMAAIGIQIGLFIERKQTEEALRAREERIRLLLDSTVEGIYGIDEQGNCTFSNRACARLLGHESGADLLGQHMHELLHHTRPDGTPYPVEQCRIYQAFRRGEGTYGDDEVFWRRDGTSFPAEYWSYPIRQGEKIIGSVVTFLDITEKKRADESRRKLATERDALLRRLQLHIQRMPLSYILFDRDFRIIDWNQTAERTFGYTRAEALGMRPNDFISPAFHEKAEEILTHVRNGDMGAHSVNENVTKNGRTITCEWFNTPLMEEDGSFGGLLCLSLDVTEKKSLQEQFQQAQKMEAVGQLAGGVAHDFNNLLTIISGYSEILLSTLGPQDPLRESVKAISEAGERAAALTRQLLAFSRKSVLEPKVLDLNEVVQETEKLLRRLIGEDILLTAVLDRTIDRVKVDPGQLGQVLMNLTINARDAMPRGGKLTVETRNIELDQQYARMRPEVQPGRYVLLTVTDTGSGMTPAVKAKIFEPFFTTKEVGKGTGLGLAVVLGIVKQSQGHVEVYSEPNIGTAFNVYLPAVTEAASAPKGIDAGATGRGTETVLLVEDEDGVRGLALLVLQTYGYTVVPAGNGKEAMGGIDKHRGKIDVLVTDVVMPGMGGPDLAQALQAQFPHLKVLFTSGYTDDAVVRHGLLHEKVAFLQKPYTPLSLVRKVRQVLDEK